MYRGGDKLHQFISDKGIKINDKCCADIGISTGGFTDVLLKENAFHVFGVDVAYGMLDYSIRRNKKVSLIERTNARYLTQTEIEDTISPFFLKVSDISLVVIDVSFISVFKILPNLMSLFKKSVSISY